MIKENLPRFVQKYGVDFVIANGENASHGKGLLRNHYEELIDAGIDVVTLGNHYDSKKELSRYIDRVDRIVRPINLITSYGGEGSIIFDVDGISIRVTNLLGTAFMKENVDNPYKTMMDLLNNEETASIHIVDFHAEATGEKQCLAAALDGKVSAVLGTHTHVQTHDAKVLPNGTAFISDVGMTGFADGILGSTKETVVPKILWGAEAKFETPNEGRGLFSAVIIDVDENTGLSKEIFPIYYQEN